LLPAISVQGIGTIYRACEFRDAFMIHNQSQFRSAGARAVISDILIIQPAHVGVESASVMTLCNTATLKCYARRPCPPAPHFALGGLMKAATLDWWLQLRHRAWNFSRDTDSNGGTFTGGFAVARRSLAARMSVQSEITNKIADGDFTA